MRPVAIIGQDIVSKLFPSENPLGKIVKANGRTYTVIGTFAKKGSMFGESEDQIIMVPITRFLMDFGADRYTINVATQAPSQLLYNQTMDKGIGAMRIARGLRPGQEEDFELYSNDSLIAAFAKIADVISARGVHHQRDRAPGGRGRHHEHHARERNGAHEGDRRAEGRRRPEDDSS